MGTAARITCVRATAKNAFTEPPSSALPPQLAVGSKMTEQIEGVQKDRKNPKGSIFVLVE